MIGERGRLSLVAALVMAPLFARPALAQPGMSQPVYGPQAAPVAQPQPQPYAQPAPAPQPYAQPEPDPYAQPSPMAPYAQPYYPPQPYPPQPYPPQAYAPPPMPPVDRGEDRHGLMIGAGFGIGRLITADVRVGFMVSPHFALFGSATAAAEFNGEGGAETAHLLMAGARVFIDRLFLEARFGRLTTGSCEDDYSCSLSDRTNDNEDEAVGQLGIGIDLIHRNNYGLEVHLEDTIVDGGQAVSGGLALTFYLH